MVVTGRLDFSWLTDASRVVAGCLCFTSVWYVVLCISYVLKILCEKNILYGCSFLCCQWCYCNSRPTHDTPKHWLATDLQFAFPIVSGKMVLDRHECLQRLCSSITNGRKFIFNENAYTASVILAVEWCLQRVLPYRVFILGLGDFVTELFIDLETLIHDASVIECSLAIGYHFAFGSVL